MQKLWKSRFVAAERDARINRNIAIALGVIALALVGIANVALILWWDWSG